MPKAELDYRKISPYFFLNQEPIGYRTMQKIGIDPVAQAKRARLLIHSLGSVGLYIAAKEKMDNEKNYYNEFILDEPVSLVHDYYLYDGRFYSYPLKHEFVLIENSIHPEERGGLTREGFKKYQKLAADPQNEGAIWYSPPGRAGNKPPFDNIFFESGRLYFFVKTDRERSVHVDIKVTPSFPIKDLLDFIAGRDPQEQEDVFYYLQNPIGIKNINNFFFKLDHFLEFIESSNDPIIYVSRRHDADKKTHHYSQIIAAIKNRTYDNVVPKSGSNIGPSYFDAESLTQPSRVEGFYYDMMRGYMQETGKERIVLYGCSATNSVTKNETAQSSISSAIENYSIAGNTTYSTASRMAGNFGLKDEDGSSMKCVQCPFCKNIVDAKVGDGKISCPECKESVSIK